MSEEQINITANLSCMKCGNSGVNIPENASDYDVITCPRCEFALGTYGQLRNALEEGAIGAFERLIEDTLKNVTAGSRGLKLMT